jgi:16S rRNA (uracil1498-N3)-methyltransferase
METILQKCVELGVSAFYPMDTERTVVRIDPEDAQRRTERWQRVAEEAAKQSGRGRIPQVHPLLSFRQALDVPPSDVRILLWEQERTNSLRSVLTPWSKGASISLFVGPEGGFSEKEAADAAAQGVIPVTLGPRILRTETAGMTAAAAILYHMEEME